VFETVQKFDEAQPALFATHVATVAGATVVSVYPVLQAVHTVADVQEAHQP